VAVVDDAGLSERGQRPVIPVDVDLVPRRAVEGVPRVRADLRLHAQLA
jgi:hypothetical protein